MSRGERGSFFRVCDHPVGGADQARTGLDLGLMPVESADTQ
jgi:hypothetical protein